jgi:PAS domain S-box-containing protein
MKIDRKSLGFKVTVPSFIIIAVVFCMLLIIISKISTIIQDDYDRIIVTMASGETAKTLSAAASDLTSAALLDNPVVINAKQKSVSDALSLLWSRNGNDGIIVAADGTILRSTLPATQTRVILHDSIPGYFTLTYTNEHYHCYTETFPLWGWRVITVGRHSRSLMERSKMGFVVPLVAIGCLFMGVGILLVLRKNLKRPVAMLISAVGKGEDVEKTGVTEFDFIGAAVNSAFRRLREKTLALENELLERSRTEQAIRAKDEHIRRLLNFTAEGIFGIDLTGVCTFCNPSGLSLLGYTSEDQLIGKNMHDLIRHCHTDGTLSPENECKICAAYLAGEKVYADDENFCRADGARFPVEYWSHPVKENDDITGAVVTFIDISQRRHLEEQLLHAQKMESIGRLAGGVAHDFNNLLTPIMGYSEFLKMDLPENSPATAKVDNILKAADKARTLVQQLLSFSRKQILDMKILDLNQVIISFTEILRRTIPENIEIHFNLMADTCGIRADMQQLEQIIMNLVVNANDAIVGNGIISIETAVVSLDSEYCRQREGVTPGRYVMLAVTDNGSGMDKETLANIFEPFFTTKGVGSGTGLGLATVYGLVKQHGGNIWVYSEPGRGTTFKIYFPIIDDMPVDAQTETSRQVTFPKGKGTILLVEDNAMARAMVHELLGMHGFEVIVAEGPKQALQMIEDQQMELLVTDVVMPDMTGPELYELLLKSHPDLKVLFMSGYTSNVIVHHGILDEGINFIQKPFAVNEFAERVKAVLTA